MSAVWPLQDHQPLAPDGALDQLERCWLRAHTEAEALRNECELLERVLHIVQADFREAQERRMQTEALRDTLATEWIDRFHSLGSRAIA